MNTQGKISRFDKWIFKLLFRKYIVQDHCHEHRITEIYKMIRKASREEFVEDSEASLNSFLKECFDKALGN